MEYAARLTRSPSRKSLVAPFVALVVGAGAATGAYALIDNSNTATSSKVIVVEQPGPHAAEIPGKNEAGTAAAISGPQVAGLTEKNEAATAAAISLQSGGIQAHLRGSKASATGTSPTSAAERARDIRTDPHGPANSLRNP
jgi:hypothetical protein